MSEGNNTAKNFPGGSVSKNTGSSHITTDNGSAHIKTDVGGMKQKAQVSVRNDVGADGTVGEGKPQVKSSD